MHSRVERGTKQTGTISRLATFRVFVFSSARNFEFRTSTIFWWNFFYIVTYFSSFFFFFFARQVAKQRNENRARTRWSRTHVRRSAPMLLFVFVRYSRCLLVGFDPAIEKWSAYLEQKREEKWSLWVETSHSVSNDKFLRSNELLNEGIKDNARYQTTSTSREYVVIKPRKARERTKIHRRDPKSVHGRGIFLFFPLFFRKKDRWNANREESSFGMYIHHRRPIFALLWNLSFSPRPVVDSCRVEGANDAVNHRDTRQLSRANRFPSRVSKCRRHSAVSSRRRAIVSGQRKREREKLPRNLADVALIRADTGTSCPLTASFSRSGRIDSTPKRRNF